MNSIQVSMASLVHVHQKCRVGDSGFEDVSKMIRESIG